MTPTILFANTTIAAREKVKFDEAAARKMFAAATAEDAAKVLAPLGYDIEHEEHIVAKRLAQVMNTFFELCPDEQVKEFVRKVSHTPSAAPTPLYLKGEARKYLLYIEEYFGKGVNELPTLKSATSFDLEMFLNWFIIRLEELRVVKAILMGKKLGIPNAALRAIIRGEK